MATTKTSWTLTKFRNDSGKLSGNLAVTGLNRSYASHRLTAAECVELATHLLNMAADIKADHKR